ncbi:MAG: T9SS type A sorting domain-containing protein [Flavobacteriales bacterium]|nr:T9SS type A sorting domain-containing protein [Flavobacteriales bacterium]
MKRIASLALVVIAFLTFQTETSNAQCPGCVIDVQCGVGLNPIVPALCPAVLPNGTQGLPYDESATFFMPRDFVDVASGQSVTLNSITVTSVTGMPQGLSYTCNVPTCAYTVTNDPLTQRGCFKICGVPTVPGNYNVIIAVVANVNTPIGVINQPTSFSIPLVIEPSPGGNCCYSYNPPSACGSLDVTYEALLNFGPLQPTTYAWDFDNGNVSASATPPVQPYTIAGDFYPELITTVNNYVITDVSFTAAGSNWCGDIEEISFAGVCQGAPDIYYTFSNGNQGSTSTSGSNNLTKTWTGLHHVLVDNIYSLQFWDEDGTSADDNLGVYTSFVTAPGTFNLNTFVNGNQEGFGTVTIALEVDTVYTTVDTVTVLPIPAMPTLAFSPAQQVCMGDSILISGPVGPYQYQWIQAGAFISDSVAVWVNETDYYSLAITDTNVFCGIESDSSLVEIFTFPLPPVIGYNMTTGELSLNNPNNYVVEWYDGNNLVSGETGNTFDPTGFGGPFTARFLNGGLCSSQSSTAYSLCLPASIQPLSNDSICCGETLTFDATGFLVNPFSVIAWAVTPESVGPVTNQASATAAENNGYLLNGFGTTASFTRDCLSHTDSVSEGSYFVTPFAIENPAVEPLTYDTLQGCRPYAQICPALDAADDNWAIFPMVFTFPDNSTLNVNDAIAFGLPINQQLLDLAGGLPCLALTDLFRGNPNGVWSITLTNTGTTAIDMSVPDFIVINSADSCNLITQDETYLIEGIEMTANPGQTVVVSFDIPPLPASFPSISAECEAFGEPVKIHFKDCYPHTSHLGIDEMDTYGFSLGECVPNPNAGTAVINFSSKFGGDYQFVIRDVTGKEVSRTTLYAAAGDNRFNFDGSTLSSGLYTYSLSNGVNVLTQRLVISK